MMIDFKDILYKLLKKLIINNIIKIKITNIIFYNRTMNNSKFALISLALIASFVFIAIKNSESSYGASVQIDLPPNQPTEFKNPIIFGIKATCNIRSEAESTDVLVTIK
jgi:hypothetical protein